jgi:hypothetical protein
MDYWLSSGPVARTVSASGGWRFFLLSRDGARSVARFSSRRARVREAPGQSSRSSRRSSRRFLQSAGRFDPRSHHSSEDGTITGRGKLKRPNRCLAPTRNHAPRNQVRSASAPYSKQIAIGPDVPVAIDERRRRQRGLSDPIDVEHLELRPGAQNERLALVVREEDLAVECDGRC